MTFHASTLNVFEADILTQVPHHVQMAFLIKNTLNNRGISQKEFARQVGITEKHMSQILTGNADPSATLLDTFAWKLGLQWVIAARELPGHKMDFGPIRDRSHG